MTPRAIAYVRKSTVEAERRSLSEQEADLRRQADRLGLTVTSVLAEEASAYAERERPVFTKALATIERGEADVLLCWSLDRFSRRGAGHVLGLVDKGLRIVTLEGIDTVNEHGRMQVAVMAESARMESHRKSAAVKRSKASARDEGRWHAGRAPYGYRTSGKGRALKLVPEPTEAATVRRMAEHLIAGESLSSCVRWLNDEGIPTPAGKAWKAKGMGLAWTNIGAKSLLRSPALAGWLPHNGDVVRDETGAPAVAHEAVIPPETWRQVQAAIKARTDTATEASRSAGGRPPTRLLSGLLFCPCGWVLAAKAGGYICSSPRGRLKKGQKHVTVQAAAEPIIARQVLQRLAALTPGDPALDAVAETWGGLTGQKDDHERRIRMDAVETAKAEVDRVVRLVAKGLIEDHEAERTLPELRGAVRKAEAKLGELGPGSVDVSFLLDLAASADQQEGGPIGPGSAWAALSQSVRRAVVRSVVRRVDVRPTGQGKRDIESRLAPVWVDRGMTE